MDVIGWTVLALYWLLTFVPGTAALCVGWVPPWFRKTVSSPRLSGWADICAGFGGTLAVGPVHRHLGGTPMSAVATTVGFCLFLGAFGLYRRSYRPAPAAASDSPGAAPQRTTAALVPAAADSHQPQAQGDF
ncbi:hypothetical protein [Actinacidiphila glaucinigra]|uniref:hypothetical protein n=1 Tax=Actinacidiphila glaucinigra TaxID=235986 RepID=UPI00366F7FC4